MAFSSYQIERVIRRLRRWIVGPFPGRSHAPDPVRGTPVAARDGAREGAADDPLSSRPGGAGHSGTGHSGTGHSGGLKAIAETREYPPVVQAERERRAGSFLHPPYPETPEQIGLPRIPKLKREVPPNARTASLGDAD